MRCIVKIRPLRISFLFIFTALLVTSSQAVATKDTSNAAPAYRVGVLYWSMNIPGQVAMRKGLEATVKQINDRSVHTRGRPVELMVHVAGDGAQGIENQISQMDSLLDSKPDLIIVQPTDNAALAQGLQRANREGVPVVAYDQYISGKGKLDCFLTSNNYQAGLHCGEYIASRFDSLQTLNIILVEYPHVSSTVERVNGFIDGLTQQKQPFHIVRTYEAVEPVAGKKAAQNIRIEHPTPGSIDVIFTVNDGGGLAVVQDLYSSDRTEIIIATVDGDPASVQNIRNNRMTVIDSAQFCWHLGANAMLAGFQLLQGNKNLPSTILLPVFPITSETMDYYQGWYGEIPESFSKPWPSSEAIWQWQLTTPNGTVVHLDDSP